MYLANMIKSELKRNELKVGRFQKCKSRYCIKDVCLEKGIQVEVNSYKLGRKRRHNVYIKLNGFGKKEVVERIMTQYYIDNFETLRFNFGSDISFIVIE